MNKFVLSVVAATSLFAGQAAAADLKLKAPKAPEVLSPWDIAFGGALMSDYNFRGISQSNRGASVTAYTETRYNINAMWQLYAGSQYWAVTLPTNPTCECDLYGGIRPTIGPLALDFGFIYYLYPRETQHLTAGVDGVTGQAFAGGAQPTYANGVSVTLPDTDYWEVYAKGTYEVVKDTFWLGFNEYYSPSWLHTGAYGDFLSGTAKYQGKAFSFAMLGEIGWYISGQAGYYWFGTTNYVPGVFSVAPPFSGVKLPNYAYWDVGIAFTRSVFTLDLRGYGTNLSKSNCFVLTADPGGYPGGGVSLANPGGFQSSWCSPTFIASLKFDLTAATNVK